MITIQIVDRIIVIKSNFETSEDSHPYELVGEGISTTEKQMGIEN